MKRILILLGIGLITVETAFAQALDGKKSPAEIIAEAGPAQWRDVEPAQILVFELQRGRVTVELSDVFAQGHVRQVKRLVKAGYYDGLSFYRVIDGFVAQGGDPFGKRELPEGTLKNLPAEFEEKQSKEVIVDSKAGFDTDVYARKVGVYNGFPIGVDHNDFRQSWLLHCTGVMAFGRNAGRDSASTEFYFTLQPQRYLDRNLTVFGKVIDGMEHLQTLKRQLPPQSEDDPLGETILRAWMGDQAPEGEAIPAWQVFRTETKIFDDYVEARRNRPEVFFYYRPNHVDVCQLTIPVREKPDGAQDLQRVE